ncbi:Tex family protein [Thermodesulfobacteriota bacterium]
MNPSHIKSISIGIDLKESHVQAVAKLLEQGATVPFIARYRKEITGNLDEVSITHIRDRLEQLQELDKRKNSILKSLKQHGHLTDELKVQVQNSTTLSNLEDIYLPYRPKRRTRATVAREKGLAPLAQEIFLQTGIDPFEAAAPFVNPAKTVDTIDDALAGARDIVAETINEDVHARSALRDLFEKKGHIKTRCLPGKESEGAKYKDYFDWQEPAISVKSHRVLAARRGEKEGFLSLTIEPPETEALMLLKHLFVKGEGEDSKQVALAVTDGYRRLLSRAMETESRLATKEKADSEAIRIFVKNLRQLLLSPPLGAKRVLGIDPGIRTGSKLACLDRQGQLIHHDILHIGMSGEKAQEAARKIKHICRLFKIEAIAVGNGTGGRETESFVRNLRLEPDVTVTLVNESGASIYSASETAREEFPDLDITIRGAVSIGRRLMDPLSELIKIDPKSIGVGQYQHDVDQKALKKALDDVTVSCVNRVGVDINRASAQLLSYISGIGPRTARNIITYRNENGPYRSRNELKAVPQMGVRAFEQSAGFLRIRNGTNCLDASAVHPESYHIVEKMAEDNGCKVIDLIRKPSIREQVDMSMYVTTVIGLPTLQDIMAELAKPGRDPRDRFEVFAFASDIHKIDDVTPGMKLPGIVTNVTAFGAFVDIGVHQDGLVHISELSDHFVTDPASIVTVHQKVIVRVKSVDSRRNRISLSMKSVSNMGP